MSVIPGHAPYDNSKLRTAFVSGLAYTIGGQSVLLPSTARNIQNADGSSLDAYAMARHYFSNNYGIANASPALQVQAVTSIAVTGLINQYNALTTDATGSNANSTIAAEISRPELMGNIKKNIVLQSSGFLPVNSSVAGKKWCSGTNIGQDFIDHPPVDCTQVINGETISFIDGNATLSCGY